MYIKSLLQLTQGLVVGIYCLSSFHFSQASITHYDQNSISPALEPESQLPRAVQGAILVQEIDGEKKPVCFMDTRGRDDLVPPSAKAAHLESNPFHLKGIDRCEQDEERQVSEMAALSSMINEDIQVAFYGKALLDLGKSLAIGCTTGIFTAVAGASIGAMTYIAGTSPEQWEENEDAQEDLRKFAETGGMAGGAVAAIVGTAVYGVNLIKQLPAKVGGFGALVCGNASLGVIYLLK